MDVPHTYHCSLQRFLKVVDFRIEAVLIISYHESLLRLRVLCDNGQVTADGQGMQSLTLVAQTLISILLVASPLVEANVKVRDFFFQQTLAIINYIKAKRAFMNQANLNPGCSSVSRIL